MSTRFVLPAELSAGEPPEARGVPRDGVRLLIAQSRRPVRHRLFHVLPGALEPGDLLVVNTSGTAAAAVDGRRSDGRAVTVHVSGPVPDAVGLLVVELRTPEGRRVEDALAGERIMLPRGVTATLLAGHPDVGVAAGSRLWRARVPVEGGVPALLSAVGRPIRYSYLRGRWPIEAYRTIFAAPDGTAEMPSAEMPSAGRPFTAAVLAGLRSRGVRVAEVVLHTGVSSLEAGEVPLPERFRVSEVTARAVNDTRAADRRVVAVGTTVTRALESAAGTDGTVRARSGWTDLVLGPDRPARVVGGLVTGWHEPDASHLLLLKAVAGAHLVERAYAAAVEQRYRWHEFGDSCLLLPPTDPARTDDRIRHSSRTVTARRALHAPGLVLGEANGLRTAVTRRGAGCPVWATSPKVCPASRPDYCAWRAESPAGSPGPPNPRATGRISPER